MGYQESFIYSKTGNNDNIEKTIDIIRKYKYQQMNVLSIAKVNLLKDFSNGHKKQFPVINWTTNTKLLMTFGERYYQRSINRLFFVDTSTRYNTSKRDDEDENLINYTDEEYAVLDDLEIVFIDDYIDPKLKGAFESYFGEPEFIKNDDMCIDKLVIVSPEDKHLRDDFSGKLLAEIHLATGKIQLQEITGNGKVINIAAGLFDDGYLFGEDATISIKYNGIEKDEENLIEFVENYGKDE